MASQKDRDTKPSKQKIEKGEREKKDAVRRGKKNMLLADDYIGKR